MNSSVYIDNYPFNIESAQKLSMQWSEDFTWDYTTQGYPTGEESVFNWTSEFKPVTYTPAGATEVLHVWMRYKVGDKGQWSTPMRINYPTIVEGPQGETGATGEKGDRGLQGLQGNSVQIQYADEYYNQVASSSSYIEYIRIRVTGSSWSSWIRVKGIPGVSSGGTGLPSGGTDTQVLAIVGTTPTWIAKTTIYSNFDAVSAMGTLGDSNPLNHNRYTDSEAVTAMGVLGDSNPLNHDRYTDAEAIAAVTGGGGLSATSPIDLTAGVISHLDTVGNKHVPSGDTSGDALVGDGSGNLSWARHLLASQLDDSGTSTADIWSASKITSMITAASFGIKYSWADATARAAETGMITGELGVQRDTDEVYRYDGAAWNFFFSLTSTHNHNTLYTLTTDLAASGSAAVHWDNITNVPATMGLWTETTNILSPSNASNIGMAFAMNSAAEVGIELANSDATAGSSAETVWKNNGGRTLAAGIYSSGSSNRAYLMGDYTTLNIGSTYALSTINFTVGGTKLSPTTIVSIDNSGIKFPSMPLMGSSPTHVAVFDTTNYISARPVGTAFNDDYGTTAGTVAEGNHLHEGLVLKDRLRAIDDMDTLDSDSLYHAEGGAYDALFTNIPNNFPDDTVLGLTNDSSYEFYVKCIVANGLEQKLQVVGTPGQGDICFRNYNSVSGLWSPWSRFEATEAQTQAGTNAFRYITPRRLRVHGSWVNATPAAGRTLDSSAPLSSRILNDGRLEISGKISAGISLTLFATISSGHAANIRKAADNYIYFSGVTTSGVMVALRMTSAGVISKADGTSTSLGLNINTVLPTV